MPASIPEYNTAQFVPSPKREPRAASLPKRGCHTKFQIQQDGSPSKPGWAAYFESAPVESLPGTASNKRILTEGGIIKKQFAIGSMRVTSDRTDNILPARPLTEQLPPASGVNANKKPPEFIQTQAKKTWLARITPAFLEQIFFGKVEGQLNNRKSTGYIPVTPDVPFFGVDIDGDAGKLHGRFYRPEDYDGKRVALYLSGSGAPCQAFTTAWVQKYSEKGIAVLAVDYRGFGDSEGEPSEQGLQRDAEAMLSHLVHTRRFEPENILLHGYSMGAPIAAHLAAHAARHGSTLGGLLLDRPMPSCYKVAKESLNHLPGAKWLAEISSWLLGRFSIKQHLLSAPRSVLPPIVMMTDTDLLGPTGEGLRRDLNGKEGFAVAGESIISRHHEHEKFADRLDDVLNNVGWHSLDHA